MVGTSGWQYSDWKGCLYPAGLPQSRWLEHYALRFQTVEINSTFYRLPERDTFEQWRDRTPEDFVFAVKASRYLTHMHLREPAEPVARLMDHASGLGHKLGPVLMQLRDTHRIDLAALDAALASFPAGTRVAFEPRHESWYCDATWELLARLDAAFCLTDTPMRTSPMQRTASWGYLRFHEGVSRPRPCYGVTALRQWSERLAALWSAEDDIYVYFNNDTYGCAVRDARRFAAVASETGLRPTRVPAQKEAALTPTWLRD